MTPILLDRTGTAPVPDGYQPIEDEVSFLRLAPEDRQLMIRGQRLCQWAEAYYSGHNRELIVAKNPVEMLCELCSGLSPVAAQTIVEQLAWTAESAPDSLTVPSLLSELYPSALWRTEPSVRHAAEWLLWLWHTKPPKYVEPLLASVASSWQARVEHPLGVLYTAYDASEATSVLDRWLGVVPVSLIEWGEFPLDIPAQWTDRAKTYWKRRITETKGQLFQQLRELPLPQALLRLAARETSSYFQVQSQYLSADAFHLLVPFLGFDEQQKLRRWVIPPRPSAMPREIEAVANWFEQEYLPYRLWQYQYGDDAAKTEMDEHGRDFAHWYLQAYAQALSGGPMREHLSFRKATAIPDAVTLVVVLDGLHMGDAQRLREHLFGLTDRLSMLDQAAVFAPVPTITELTKECIFRGVQPSGWEEVAPLGEIIRDIDSPIQVLAGAEAGTLFFWRIRDPDYTYHSRNSSSSLVHDVESALANVASKLAEIVNSVPASKRLRLVVTTDHGRLLGRSQREHSVPPGMTSHGRAAHGAQANVSFSSTGYHLSDDIVYLYAPRFGLKTDVAIVFGDGAFLTEDGKRGIENFAHGGLFPEEVIVPWYHMARDFSYPDIRLEVSGNGVARDQGELSIEVVNYSDIEVVVVELVLTLGEQDTSISLDQTLDPRATVTLQKTFSPWPESSLGATAKVAVRVALPSGPTWTTDGTITLTSEELYSRPDDLLKELDL